MSLRRNFTGARDKEKLPRRRTLRRVSLRASMVENSQSNLPKPNLSAITTRTSLLDLFEWADTPWLVAAFLGLWGVMIGVSAYRMADVFVVLASVSTLFQLGRNTLRARPRRISQFLIGLAFIAALVTVDIHWTHATKVSSEERDGQIQEIPALKKQVFDLNEKLKDLPTSKQIAKDLREMEQNPTPLVTERVPKTPSKKVPTAPSTPVQQQPRNPQTQVPQYGTLKVSQTTLTSTAPDAHNHIQVVIQTDVSFPSLKLLLKCNQPMVSAKGEIQGGQLRMMTGDGIVNSDPTLYSFYYASATPPFGPANPIVVDVYAVNPITCTTASTY